MEDHLIIDWEKIHLYNSLMALVTGAAFLSLWSVFKKIYDKKEIRPVGIAMNLFVVGLILFITGVHTTLTWPLAPTYPFDNSIFGEPCFVFGSLLLAVSFYFWKQRKQLTRMTNEDTSLLGPSIIGDFNEFRYIILGIGLAVIAMGAAGIHYRIFIAPPEEPIMGPMLEVIPNFTSFVIGFSWILVGIAAIGLVYYMRSVVQNKGGNYKWLLFLLLFLGINFTFLGVSTYYTHVGFEINTMDPSTIKPNVINRPDPNFQKQVPSQSEESN